MTTMDFPVPAVSRSAPAISSERSAVVWIGASLLVIATMMVWADGPVATWLAHEPPAIARAVGAFAAPIKGSQLITIAFVVTLASACGFLLSHGRRRVMLRDAGIDAGFVLAASVVALLCATILKVLIGRARPELMMIHGPHAFFPVSTSQLLTSFPSGETSMVAAFFGALTLALRRRGGAFRSSAWLALIPLALVAISRPIVGAHYLSDVAAALLLAACVVLSLDAGLARIRANAGKAMNGLWLRFHAQLH